MELDSVLIILEGSQMDTQEHLWEEVTRKVPVPDYFGKNLDAWADVLGEHWQEWNIKVRDDECIPEKLGVYGESFLHILHRFM